jgi:hypothetical protein
VSSETATRHIPRRVRGAILNWFENNTVPPKEVHEELQQRAVLGDDRDLMAHLRERYGDPEADALRDGVSEEFDRLCDERLGAMGRQLSAATTAPVRDRIWREERPRLVLLHLPDALFATAIEGACPRLAYNYDLYHDHPGPDAKAYVNGVFDEHGVPYRLTEDGLVEWVGDEALHEVVMAPALAALSDERVGIAREDFEHALANVRRGSVKSRKDAVNDATKALEGAMVATLEANGHSAPQRRQVWPLCEELRDRGVVPRELMELITAGSKVSNARGRHTNPEPVTQAEAEASVAAVAIAITYLSTRLP